MQKDLSFQLSPEDAATPDILKQAVARAGGLALTELNGFHILKRSIDARGRRIRINLSVRAFIGEPEQDRTRMAFNYRNVRNADRQVVIIGAGPAGLFAALRLLEAGIRPVILERGKDVRARRRDLARLNREGILDEDSNYCFGEGGAGTYSDGKLYTRSSKRGDIDRILQVFVRFGAEDRILYESHPHIGTNKLPHIITAMREQVEDAGGKVLFGKRVTDFERKGDRISAVLTSDGDRIRADAFILATGHSARDPAGGETTGHRCPRGTSTVSDRPDPVSLRARISQTRSAAACRLQPGRTGQGAGRILLLHVPGRHHRHRLHLSGRTRGERLESVQTQ